MKNLLSKIYSALNQESSYENAALFILTFAAIMAVVTTITSGTTY
jgi:hypothetical protein